MRRGGGEGRNERMESGKSEMIKEEEKKLLK
jgi:hypothetical protein